MKPTITYDPDEYIHLQRGAHLAQAFINYPKCWYCGKRSVLHVNCNVLKPYSINVGIRKITLPHGDQTYLCSHCMTKLNLHRLGDEIKVKLHLEQVTQLINATQHRDMNNAHRSVSGNGVNL